MTDTIGQRLKKAREYRNLTLEKVEGAIHIRLKFLQALESDDFSAMPSPVQARGFLRNYAQYLDLDLDQIEAHALPIDIGKGQVRHALQAQPIASPAQRLDRLRS